MGWDASRWDGTKNSGVVIVALVGLLVLSGCATAGVALFGAGSGVAMGTSVEYSLNGIAYKTFSAPVENVRVATLKGLNTMGMSVTKDEKADNGWTLEVTANQRVIDIELERLTEKTTRMRVVADDGLIFKDRATETEIIAQAADALDEQRPGIKAARLVK